ncbi:helix-turn-helix transcriptional regulator [Microbacterium sp.]|uniref:helix-turn-helix transcriptional regulator n=1 Tax=Microbacterium sp. TaxID=51671 RepID=UPI0028AFF429|nr:helix-turn-helix transcriptional regulator [Microbacterium sp.]
MADTADSTPLHAGVEMVRRIVQPLAAALGEGVEVVLHDLTKVPDSIIAIGGHTSGRSVGGPSTDLLLKHVREQRTDHLLRYANRTADGRTVMSSTIFLRDDERHAVACLCINADVSEWERVRGLVSAMLPASSITSDGVDEGTEERFFETTDDLVSTMINSAVTDVAVPVELMQKRHKIRVVESLEARGFFSFREAAELLAKSLQVSRYTIYNYLNEIRAHAPESSSAPTQNEKRETK